MRNQFNTFPAKNGIRLMKILLCMTMLAAVMILCAACGSEQGPEGIRRPEPEGDEAAMTCYTLKEYIDKAPRIMIIDKPRFIDKNGSVEKLYIIADDTVIEKRTVSTENYKSLEELQALDAEGWSTYLKNVKPIRYGELAKMSMDEIWEYAAALETVREVPLTFTLKTDRTGNRAVWEEISDLADGKMMYVQKGEAEWSYYNIYDKDFTGFSVLNPRDRNGFFFISEEPVIITLDTPNTPGIKVD